MAKKRPMPQNVHSLCYPDPKPKPGFVAQIEIPSAPSLPMSPLFLGFSSLRIAQRGGAKELPVLHTMGSIGVPKVKKSFFPHLFLHRFGCSKKRF